MPLYEYRCSACGHRFEVIRKFSDAPLTECPKCGGTVEKLISSPAFTFKGSGFYATDYGKKSEGSKAEGSKSEGSNSETKPDSSSAESKTESKSTESKTKESSSSETPSTSKSSSSDTP